MGFQVPIEVHEKKLCSYLIDEMGYDPEVAIEIIDQDEYTCYGTPAQYGRFLFEYEVVPSFSGVDSWVIDNLKKSIDFEKFGLHEINDINRFLIDGEIYEIYNY